MGPEYWANRLQDWRVVNGRLECVTSGVDRNVHLLTHQLTGNNGRFTMAVRTGRLGGPDATGANGWVGFRIGILGPWQDYRDSVRRHGGVQIGVRTDGTVFVGKAGPGIAIGKVEIA